MKASDARAYRDRAFATLVAVVMISLVGSALLAMTVLVQVDSRRSQRVNTEVQLRQLLLAGGVAARESIMDNPAGAWSQTLELPADMEEASVKIDFSISDQSRRTVTVTARDGDYRASQTMAFELQNGAWELAAVELNRPY